MVLSKMLKCAAAVVLIAGVTLGLGWRNLVEEARAEKPVAAKPVKAEADKNTADKPPVGATVSGTIKSTNAARKTVTLTVPLGNGTKETKDDKKTSPPDSAISGE